MLLADVVREVVPGEHADVIIEKLNDKLADIGGDLPAAPDAEETSEDK